MIRTGIFGGSFNPIHQGHIAVADFFYHSKILDEIWFVVSPQNPLKRPNDLEDAATRLQEVKAAVKDYPQFKVSDIEFALPRPSYMAQTLKTLSQEYPDRCFSLIIGGDNLDIFSAWKDSDYILQNYDILVYPRPGYGNRVPTEWKRVHLFEEARMMDISSTQIRENKKKQL